MSVLNDDPLMVPNISDWFKVSIDLEGATTQDYSDWNMRNRVPGHMTITKFNGEKEILEKFRNALRNELIAMYMANPFDCVNWQSHFHKIFVRKVSDCWACELGDLRITMKQRYLSTLHMRGTQGLYVNEIELRCQMSKYEKVITIDFEPRFGIIDEWWINEHGNLDT